MDISIVSRSMDSDRLARMESMMMDLMNHVAQQDNRAMSDSRDTTNIHKILRRSDDINSKVSEISTNTRNIYSTPLLELPSYIKFKFVHLFKRGIVSILLLPFTVLYYFISNFIYYPMKDSALFVIRPLKLILGYILWILLFVNIAYVMIHYDVSSRYIYDILHPILGPTIYFVRELYINQKHIVCDVADNMNISEYISSGYDWVLDSLKYLLHSVVNELNPFKRLW